MVLSLYRKIQVRENPYSDIFHSVRISFQVVTLDLWCTIWTFLRRPVTAISLSDLFGFNSGKSDK